MSTLADSEPTTHVADRLYASRCALTDATPKAGRVGIAELLNVLTDPSAELSPDAQRALFSNPRLRAALKRLKVSLRCAELPALAAASDGKVDSRTFDGGMVRIHASRIAGQVYALFQFTWPSGGRRALLLEDASGQIVKRHLPAPDATGQAMLVLDQNQPSDRTFLRLIADPTTVGTFIL